MRSGASVMSSASSPYMVATSSEEPIASVSNMSDDTPAAATPLSENGLNLSKLLRRSGLARYKVPRLGASGLTYSKWVNPAGYLGVSYSEKAWAAKAALLKPAPTTVVTATARLSSSEGSVNLRMRPDHVGFPDWAIYQ